MSWDDIKVKISSYFEGKGYADWIKSSNTAATSAAKATQKASVLAGVMGQMDGALGNAAGGVARVAQGFAMLGPAGAAIAGLKAVVDMVGNHFVKKAEEMKEAVERMGERIRANLDKLKAKTLEEINDQLAKATTEAAAAASRFDALASAYMKVAQAKDAAAKASGDVAVSSLALEKQRKMSAVTEKAEQRIEKTNPTEPEADAIRRDAQRKKAVIGAEYDVRIAEKTLANTVDAQDRNVSNVRKESADAKKRLTAAKSTEREAELAVTTARDRYDRNVNANSRKSVLDELKAKISEAEKALETAVNNRIRAEADATASGQKIAEAESIRVAAINRATESLEAAKAAQSDLASAQRDAAKAIVERARLDPEVAKVEKSRADNDVKEAEDGLVDARRRNDDTDIKRSIARLEDARAFSNELSKANEEAIRAQKERTKAEMAAADAARRKAEADAKAASDQDNAGILSSAKGDFSSKFERAFDLWRDPEASAAAVESDKKRSSDLKAFNKAVNRYGGKGKIDEYAALMRAGDEEGMQSRLDQWRKSSKFTPQVEQMVKAEAARQNENASERALANIEKNTANLDKKLDQLLSIK